MSPQEANNRVVLDYGNLVWSYTSGSQRNNQKYRKVILYNHVP